MLPAAKAQAVCRAVAGQPARAAQPTGIAAAASPSASPATQSLLPMGAGFFPTGISIQDPSQWMSLQCNQGTFCHSESYFACTVVDLLNCIRVPLGSPVLRKLVSEKLDLNKRGKSCPDE